MLERKREIEGRKRSLGLVYHAITNDNQYDRMIHTFFADIKKTPDGEIKSDIRNQPPLSIQGIMFNGHNRKR